MIVKLDFLLDWIRTVFILSHWGSLSLLSFIDIVLFLNLNYVINSFFRLFFWKFNQFNLILFLLFCWLYWFFNVINWILDLFRLDIIFFHLNNLKIWTVIFIIKHNDIVIIIRRLDILWLLILNFFVIIFIFFNNELLLILYLCLSQFLIMNQPNHTNFFHGIFICNY